MSFHEEHETKQQLLIWFNGSLCLVAGSGILSILPHSRLFLLCQQGCLLSPVPLWFMGPASDHPPPLDPLSCSTSLLQPVTCWMLTDDAPRSYMENTQHLLQLLSLTTIFEFDGLSNYIPPLFCHRGSGETTNQAADVVATEDCCGRLMPLIQGGKSSSFFLLINCFSKESQTCVAPSCELSSKQSLVAACLHNV